jgi:hypothetical protein
MGISARTNGHRKLSLSGRKKGICLGDSDASADIDVNIGNICSQNGVLDEMGSIPV